MMVMIWGNDFLTIFGSVNFAGVVTESEKHWVTNSTLDFSGVAGLLSLWFEATNSL